jgi:hypothetical protein
VFYHEPQRTETSGFSSRSEYKTQRISRQLESTASTSFETQNYFSLLADSNSDTESAVSTPPSPSRKERIPPIVLYSYLNNYSQSQETLNDKYSSPVDVKTKTNWLLLYTKTLVDYEILLREIKQAQLAYSTYPLPNTHQPRVALNGISPNATIEEIR